MPSYVVSWSSTVLSASPPSPQGIVLDSNYLQLYGVHEKNLELMSGPVSAQVLRNHKATLKSYLIFCNRNEESRVGREFTVDFIKRSRAFGDHVAVQNRKTAADKLSILRSWKRTIDKQIREATLKNMAGHSTFHKELRLAIAESGKSLKEIAKAIYLDVKSLTGWHEGVMPIFKAIPAVRRLENYLGLSNGFLEKKIVFQKDHEPKAAQALADRYEVRAREARKDPYYVATSDFSAQLMSEWGAFMAYKTQMHPIGLKRSKRAAWRVLPAEKAGIGVRDELLVCPAPNMVASSALRTLLFLRGYFGFLIKPSTGNRATSGLGLKLEDVGTLASLAIPEFVAAYMEFVKARSGNLLHNGHGNAAGIIVGVCREIEGYLWQQPEVFEERVAQFAKNRPWHTLCQQTVAVCKSWQAASAGRKSRDPKELLQPLFALKDILAPFKRAIQKLDLAAAAAVPGSVHQALFKRDALILGLSLFNPLRHRTLTITKYIAPGQQSDLISNLFQAEDGHWWLRFEKGDFKNDESKPEDYRSPITKGLTHRIDEYINIYRPTLVRARQDSSCLFPSRQGEQIRDIGEIVNRIAKSYIPEVRRLRLHALRHIVATDFLLRNPGKYTLLAGLLHDTLATVLKTYAHGKTESAFRAHEENMTEFYQGL